MGSLQERKIEMEGRRKAQLTTDEAIRIAKIICQAPEERLPMIVEVFQKSDLTIESIEELYEWRALKNQVAIVDIEDFAKELIGHFEPGALGNPQDDIIAIPTTDFTKYCMEKHIKPALAKKALMLKGYLAIKQKEAVAKGTEVVKVNGKATRCVLVYKDSHCETKGEVM